MRSHPAHLIALGFGTGLSPIAPGTIGTLLAFPLYAVLLRWLSPLGVLVLCVFLFLIGIWATERTGRVMGQQDPGCFTFDEIVAFLTVLVFTPAGWMWQLGAFVAFRFFDIVKPVPIRYLERRIKGGLGAMLDDLLAAGYTLLLLAAIKSIVS